MKRLVYIGGQPRRAIKGVSLMMTDAEIVDLYTKTAPDMYAIENLREYLEGWRDDVALDDDGNFKLLDFDLDRWREDHARKYTVMVETEPDVVGPDSHFEDIWSARRHAHSLASGSAIDVYIDCFTKTYIEGNVEWIYEYHEDVTVNTTSTRAYLRNKGEDHV